MAAASLGVLAQATALEELCLVRLEDAISLEGLEVFSSVGSRAKAGAAHADELAVLEWAGRRPGLRRLSLGSRLFRQYTPAQAAALAAAAGRATAANAGLRVERDWRLYREVAEQLAMRRLVEQLHPDSAPPPEKQPPADDAPDSDYYTSSSDDDCW